MDSNLLSAGIICEKGHTIVMKNRTVKIYKKRKLIAVGTQGLNNLFKLNLDHKQAYALLARSTSSNIAKLEDSKLWHYRLGHLGINNMKLIQDRVYGINMTDNEIAHSSICEHCLSGGQHAQPSTHNATRASDVLELIHTDICGPMNTKSAGGMRYFITFTDDKTRMTFGYFMRTKNEALEKFKIFKNLVENQQSGKRIKRLRSDNGGEYMSKSFRQLLNDHGIIHETTAPYHPEQNGVSERANRTIVERAKSMLHASKLGLEFWAEATATTIYLKNRSPTKAVEGMTPYEAWFGKKPILGHLKIFGCIAYAHIPKQKRKKLYRRVEILRFPFLGPFEFRLGHVGVPSSSSIFPELALARRRRVAASSNLTPGPRANDRGTTFGFQSLSVLGLYRNARRTLMSALFPTPLFVAGEIFLGLSLTIFAGSLIATLGDRVRTRRR